MDRLWDEFIGRGRELATSEGEWIPNIDLSETKNDILVKANLPGMEAKDIDISISGDTLTIKGESKEEKEE
jgi:HSP20 family protein